MDKRLSILHADKEINLEPNKASGIISTALKMISVFAPKWGQVMAEVVTRAIPDHRVDNLVTFAQVLEIKLEGLREDLVKERLMSKEGSDLFEEAMSQAARAISEERKEYIASLLKNGLTLDDLNHIEKKKLFSLLNEINDAEILLLKYHSLTGANEHQEFAEKHIELFTPISVHMGVAEEVIDKASFRSSYRDKLIEIGLLEPVFKQIKKGEMPEFDQETGRIKATGYRATRLGKVLLKYIDFSEP